jgi:phosphate:Na+ symporter
VPLCRTGARNGDGCSIMGLLAFNFGRRTWIRDVGRAAIGLGLMLLALHILLDTLD